MPSSLVTRTETACYLAQLHDCFAVWEGAMHWIRHHATESIPHESLLATIVLVALAHHRLTRLSVTPPMLAVHHAALDLLQSAIDALDAIAAGRGKPAVRDMSEQLMIFQAELVLFAEQAGFISDR